MPCLYIDFYIDFYVDFYVDFIEIKKYAIIELNSLNCLYSHFNFLIFTAKGTLGNII